MIIYLDIETLPDGKEPEVTLPEKPTMDDVKTRAKTDEAKIKAEKEEKYPIILSEWKLKCSSIKEKSLESHKKQAIDPLKCKILCVGIAFDNEPVEIISGSEKQIIGILNSRIANLTTAERSSIQFCGYNIKNFDLSVIFPRVIKYHAFTLKYVLQMNTSIIELSEEFKYNKYDKRFYKFDDVCKFFGLKGKGDIDGSMVYDMWKSGKTEEIYKYCVDDVEQTRQLYKKMML